MSHNDTSYFSALPSFWEDMARVLDMAVTLAIYNDDQGPVPADYIALRDDWMAIGYDLSVAIREYEQYQRELAQWR